MTDTPLSPTTLKVLELLSTTVERRTRRTTYARWLIARPVRRRLPWRHWQKQGWSSAGKVRSARSPMRRAHSAGMRLFGG